ncbi:MAG: aspartate carbamoyltransferase regulatory subunit [Thermoplasmata archaeon]|nr:MAG: aspartate carbamoyltransferase regulatory subunit [Thermoplasmata archaeon]
MKKEFKVTPIQNGTVIDHITEGMALKVLKILHITGTGKSIVSVAMNVPSEKCEMKDIVKVEDRELEPRELDKIALIAPNATVSFIRDMEIVKKHRVNLPDMVDGILRCSNPNCISNKSEPVEYKAVVTNRDPLTLKCYYCDREQEDVVGNII